MRKEMNDYQFDFSIIMSVYNVDEYIDEAIESLVNQNFPFERVQLILVNDGSTDNSGIICEKYKEQYPDNIRVIHKENGGVSSAKNEGLKYIEGKYVNFFDPDDKLSKNTLSSVYKFFEDHNEETDVVAIPLFFFEAMTGEHPLNYKFKKGSRVIDLKYEYRCMLGSGASAFYNHDAIAKIHFDEHLLTSEDMKANMQVLLEKMTLGVVSDAKYHYRRRKSQNQSLLHSSVNNKQYYIGYVENIAEYIIDYSKEKYGSIPRFIQYSLMYDLGWKYRSGELPSGVFCTSEESAYQEKLFKLLKEIDDDIIMSVNNIDEDTKYFLRWKKRTYETASTEDRYKAIWLQDRGVSAILDFMEIKKNRVIIEGRITAPLAFGKPQIVADTNCKVLFCNSFEKGQPIKCSGEIRSIRYPFKVELELDDNIEIHTLRLSTIILDRELELNRISYGKYFPITNRYRSSYFCAGKWKLSKSGGQLEFRKVGRKGKIYSELQFLREIWKSKRLGARKACFARILYWMLRPFKKKQIWLICDKADKADDNGEIFFEYVMSQNDKHIQAYFLIDKNAVDYIRVKRIGKVIQYMSKLHKFIYLFADYTISAYSHNEINNPFQQQNEFYLDILHGCRYIFLQHGVILHDLSAGLNKFHKGIYGFITSAKKETECVIDTCFYNEKQLWELGLPRYDKLYNNDSRVISIMPTWRRYLFSGFISQNDRWILKDGFENSEFYIFYNSILNNEKLLNAAEKYRYKIQFVPHSVFFPYMKAFKVPDQVRIVGYGTRYRDIFAESSLVLTDYSSIAFDVAYLHKPIIYSQFDKGRFYTEHGYKQGYFDYEKNGFGEVEYDLESTVNRIIEYMRDGCRMKEMYKKRVDAFFSYHDGNSCKRVYDRIMKNLDDA